MKETHFLSAQAQRDFPEFFSEIYSRFNTYRRLYGRRSFEAMPRSILDSIPSLTERDYHQLTREVLKERSGGRFMVDVTSGTTGIPKCRISTELDEAAEARLSERYFRHLGLGKGDTVVALDIDSSDIYTFYGMVFLELGVDTFLFESVNKDYVIRGWHRVDPTVVISVPSLLYRLLPAIRLARVQGHLHNLSKVICIGEPTESHLVQLLQSQMDAECFSFYGCTETGSVAGECRLHSGLHVLDDQVVLSVRPNKRTTPQVGELLWTTLHFTDHPVVKYESGDIATVLADKCPCGLPGEVLTGIRRKQDHFSLFGHQFDYQHISAVVENAIGEYSALRIEIENGKIPTFRFFLPSTFRQQSATITSALLHSEDLGYFVERGFVDWTLDFDDTLAFGSRKARRVVDKRPSRG